MNIGLIIIVLIGFVSFIGMGSILYSLVFEKDITTTVRAKPAQFYPQKINPMDQKIKSILDDENFDINNWYSNDTDLDTKTVILDP